MKHNRVSGKPVRKWELVGESHQNLYQQDLECVRKKRLSKHNNIGPTNMLQPTNVMLFLHGDQDMEDILGGASWNLPGLANN